MKLKKALLVVDAQNDFARAGCWQSGKAIKSSLT